MVVGVGKPYDARTMTLQEALRELELTSPVEPRAIRSAYLRLLQVRRPETDPQGFMRLREAY
ncbi:MAG TPA: hypothetical protein VFO83_08860, partial [Aggregicoccus sp.]|nr:hypothetical protein [Aggregicoccus sp.]